MFFLLVTESFFTDNLGVSYDDTFLFMNLEDKQSFSVFIVLMKMSEHRNRFFFDYYFLVV